MRFGALFTILMLFAAPGAHATSCQQRFQDFSAQWLEAGKFLPSDFAPIPARELTDIVNGKPGPRLFTATYQGETVVGKRATFGKLKEAAWLRELNKLGLGAKLHGLTIAKDGDYFFVMEHVPGINTNQPNFGTSIKKSAFEEMRRQFEVLAAHDIFPVDLQFQVARDGRVAIVDPEYFEIKRGLFARPERLWQLFSASVKMNFEIEP